MEYCRCCRADTLARLSFATSAANLFRDISAMAPKPKRTNSNDDDDAAGPSGEGFSTCNFCLRVKQLLPDRRY